MKEKEQSYQQREERRNDISQDEREWKVCGERERTGMERAYQRRREGKWRKDIRQVEKQLEQKEKDGGVGYIREAGRNVKCVP